MTPEFQKALIAARKDYKTLVKNKVNPHFKSRYADLSALHDAVDDALAKHGFTVTQPLEFDAQGRYCVVTKLTHSSGGEVASAFPLPLEAKPQEIVSASTYGRRASLSCLLAVPSEDDDDGEEATARHEERKAAPPPPPPKVQDKPVAKSPVLPGTQWTGKVYSVTQPTMGKWNMIGPKGESFWTDDPEKSALLSTAQSHGEEVEIKFKPNGKGANVIESVEVKA